MRVLQLKEFSELSERRKVPVLDWRAGRVRWTERVGQASQTQSALDRQAKVTVLSETCACP
jgi:hypothetical protein